MFFKNNRHKSKDNNGQTSEQFIGQETNSSIDGIQFIRKFTEQYAPYTLDDYTIKARSYDDIPQIDENHPQLRSMAYQVDLKRSEDPMVGAKIASQEIYVNITNMLKDNKGVHVETLLAVLASLGGRICVQGLMNTIDKMVASDSPERKKLINAVATILQIFIVETQNGDIYIMGDRIGNEFMTFYNNAIAEVGDVQKLIPIAKKTSELAGNEDYWKTTFDDLVRISPKELADKFNGVFEVTFRTYCRFPQERMIAVAFAAQRAVHEAVKNNILEKDKAVSIIAEYGWRTAHYLAN